MNNTSSFPFPGALKMPLRDLLRGVSNAAELTEDVLKPAVAALPAPLREPLSRAFHAFEDATMSAGRVTLDADDLRAAALLLEGGTDASAAARVFAFAWDRLHESDGVHSHLMFSETMAAAHIGRIARRVHPGPAARAAALLIDLRASNVIGPMPGGPVHARPEDQERINLILCATLVWLLADPAASFAEQIGLLDLSAALAHAVLPDGLAHEDDAEAIAARLHDLAEHL